MKRFTCLSCFALLALLLFSLPVCAEDSPRFDENAELESAWQTFLRTIPDEVASALPEGFFSQDPQQTEQALREQGGIRAVLHTLGKCTGLAFDEALSLLAQICGILLLCAMLRALTPSSEKQGAGAAFSFCSSLALLILLLTLQKESLTQINAYFRTVHTLSLGFLPMMGVLYAMGGNVRAAVLNHGVFSAFLTILETFCTGTVMPIAGICLCMALIDATVERVDLRPLAGLIKRSYALCISFLMMLLCAVLGVQSTLAKAGDTLALRTASFAAGSFLPLVGGSIAQTLRTVAGSVEYLRGVAGTGAIMVLFFTFLPGFLSVLLTRVAFLLGGSFAKLLSCHAQEKILTELAAIYGYFLATMSAVFVMLVFSLTLFARCAAG